MLHEILAGEKRCARCQEIKLRSDFGIDARAIDGLTSYCVSCRRGACRDSAAKHSKARWQRQRKTKWGMRLCAYAKRRAKVKQLPFDLCVQDIEERVLRGFCEASGLPFDLSGAGGFNAPSLDQRVAGAGYTPSNVRVILFGLNVALGNWGEDKLIEAVMALVNMRESLDVAA